MKRLVVFLLIVASLAVGLKITLNMYMRKPLGLSENLIYEVRKGASLSSVATELSQKGVIVYPRLFVKLGQFYGFSSKLKFGEYELLPTDDYNNLLSKITSGNNYKYKITFVEGDHLYNYAKQIEKKGLGKAATFLKLVKDPSFVNQMIGERQKSLEGYLYPETYMFSKNDGVKTIIKTMTGRFNKVTDGLNFNQFGLNRHKLITLASIIEKETGVGMERGLVSSVFHNRMKKRMRLQTDPTIIYGILDRTGVEIKNIKPSHIRGPKAGKVYNTYIIKGLPPGPISNPSLASIKAALNPKKSEYLYFVSQNNGTHVFSKTYEEHKKAVRRYQLGGSKKKKTN